ncbi:UBC-like protein [Westerdykella ornata]|uniref:Ubiquitin-conjugating enzyme E2 Z n=1 Tax=Westerdykella ornata TaxID=318751 RepID=A0A6A6JLQ5_WESOR|nr:UBC-like protein [Westerdykella ornata]KAF2277521.1 UBC-like protein [Westerdykella ornata]
MANQCILRISRELGEIQKAADLSLAAACRDSDVRHVRALIVGPPDTPYEFGFFEFKIRFGKEYPTKPPTVEAITTDRGQTRFNPNIYAGGKVCLSILGTWRGEPGEQWSSAQGLESVLISIQSLMSENPYENEPGFEDARTPQDKIMQAAYAAKIRHETLRISVIDRLEGYLGIDQGRNGPVITVQPEFEAANEEPAWEPFKDLCKRRFLWYYESYKRAIEEEGMKHKDNTPFQKMPFEGGGNSMNGTFQYQALKKRLERIYEKLEEEKQQWIKEGKEAVQKESSKAVNLQRQFEQVVEAYKNQEMVNVELDLVDSNPFLWRLVLFGRPMTNLDGSMICVQIHLSPRFPEELPRAVMDPPIFHHRVSPKGIVCYHTRRVDDMGSHVNAIIQAIEEEAPAYDPRTLVNPEASRLLWGGPENKKIYNRRVRRSAEATME